MSLGMIEDCRERSSRRRSLDYRPGDETSGEIPLCGCGHERICGNPKSGFGFSDSPDLTARHEEAASSSRSRRSPSRFPFAIRNRSTTLPYRPSPVAIVVDGGGGSFPAPAGERNDRPALDLVFSSPLPALKNQNLHRSSNLEYTVLEVMGSDIDGDQLTRLAEDFCYSRLIVNSDDFCFIDTAGIVDSSAGFEFYRLNDIFSWSDYGVDRQSEMGGDSAAPSLPWNRCSMRTREELAPDQQGDGESLEELGK